MPKPYTPPFSTTPTIVGLVAEIAEAIGRTAVAVESAATLRLRRINRIRTIQGTLAIEGNTLSEAQITAVLDGKRVFAPPREVQEVRNAILAYERFEHWNPASEDDLLTAHGLLMTGLVDQPGRYRSGGVGVMAGTSVIHRAPPATRVPGLMSDLLHWLDACTEHPLISSCVFHYEFEFIHPFDDGNGRMGRLWQTLILSRWKSLFAFLPIETIIHAHQGDYYQAIQESTQAGASTVFVEFMLGVIQTALADQVTEQGTEQATEQVERLLLALGDGPFSSKELMAQLGLSHRPSFLYDYLQPALAGGWLEMTIPHRPRSPKQQYRLTQAGRALRQGLLRN